MLRWNLFCSRSSLVAEAACIVAALIHDFLGALLELQHGMDRIDVGNRTCDQSRLYRLQALHNNLLCW
jgi:hypothetical protein